MKHVKSGITMKHVKIGMNSSDTNNTHDMWRLAWILVILSTNMKHVEIGMNSSDTINTHEVCEDWHEL